MRRQVSVSDVIRHVTTQLDRAAALAGEELGQPFAGVDEGEVVRAARQALLPARVILYRSQHFKQTVYCNFTVGGAKPEPHRGLRSATRQIGRERPMCRKSNIPFTIPTLFQYTPNASSAMMQYFHLKMTHMQATVQPVLRGAAMVWRPGLAAMRRLSGRCGQNRLHTALFTTDQNG